MLLGQVKPPLVGRLRQTCCPYVDADVRRVSWLNRLREIVDAHDGCERAVLACSALTASSRSILGFGLPHVWSVLLDGSQGKIASRLKIREDHFLPTLLLRSQIALLEPEHSGLTLNIE